MLWIVLSTVISSCGHVNIYDKQVCGDLGPDGAHCNNTLTTNKVDYDKETWDKKRLGWMCVDPTAFNDTETAIDQLCTTTKKCTYKQRQKMEAVKARIREVGTMAKAAQLKFAEENLE